MAYFRKPWERRDDGDHFSRKPKAGGFRKPWERDADDEGGGERFERKPREFRPARDSEGFGGRFSRKPRSEAPRGGSFRKPWERSGDDERGGGERFERKPRSEAPRGGSFRKPWERGGDDERGGGERFERKPRFEAQRGGSFRKPWERGGDDERGGGRFERKPWDRGGEDRFERKPRVSAPRKPRVAPPPAEGEMLYGRQPVRETLRAGRRKVNLVVFSDGVKDSEEILEIKSLCETAGVKVEYFKREDLEAWTNGANHQGVCAFAEAFPYSELDEIADAFAAVQDNATVVVLDHVQDPQNLGSILRTCECAGVVGVVLPVARAVEVTPAAVRASAGAAEHLKIARVSNLVVALERFKGCGAWITGLEAVPSAKPYSKIDYSGKVCLVIGSESHGICSPVRRKCDFMARLPLCGSVNSLNAGVAAALALYEILRQHGVNDDPAAFPAVAEPQETAEAEPSPDAQADFESAPAPETEAGVAPESDSGAPSPDECGGAADQPADSE